MSGTYFSCSPARFGGQHRFTNLSSLVGEKAATAQLHPLLGKVAGSSEEPCQGWVSTVLLYCVLTTVLCTVQVYPALVEFAGGGPEQCGHLVHYLNTRLRVWSVLG